MSPLTADESLPPEVTRFLADEIFSVPQLEALLLVHAAGGRVLPTTDIAREFYLPASAFVPWLRAFAGRGLLVQEADGYRALASDDPKAGIIAAVADTYGRRRITVTRLIYRASQDPAQRFADAFRLRKDKP